MSDRKPIERVMYIKHEELADAVREWLDERGLDDYPEDQQRLLAGFFQDGWSECIRRSMAPARDLCMMLLQVIQVAKTLEEPKVVLTKDSLDSIEELVYKVVGKPEAWQLDEIVEAVRVDDDDMPDDVPDDVRKALEEAKAKLKEGN